MKSEIRDVLVSSLGLTEPAAEALSLYGYQRVADLLGASRADLLRVMGIGEPTVFALEKALARLGLDPRAILSGTGPPRLPPCLDLALRAGPIEGLAALEKFLKYREFDALIRRLARADTFEAIASTWNANPERARQVVAKACQRARYLLKRDESWFGAIGRVDEILDVLPALTHQGIFEVTAPILGWRRDALPDELDSLAVLIGASSHLAPGKHGVQHYLCKDRRAAKAYIQAMDSQRSSVKARSTFPADYLGDEDAALGQLLGRERWRLSIAAFRNDQRRRPSNVYLVGAAIVRIQSSDRHEIAVDEDAFQAPRPASNISAVRRNPGCPPPLARGRFGNEQIDCLCGLAALGPNSRLAQGREPAPLQGRFQDRFGCQEIWIQGEIGVRRVLSYGQVGGAHVQVDRLRTNQGERRVVRNEGIERVEENPSSVDVILLKLARHLRSPSSNPGAPLLRLAHGQGT